MNLSKIGIATTWSISCIMTIALAAGVPTQSTPMNIENNQPVSNEIHANLGIELSRGPLSDSIWWICSGGVRDGLDCARDSCGPGGRCEALLVLSFEN